MGARYIIEITCQCGYADGAYYAPTCGFLTWTCPRCRAVIDLEAWCGITPAQASNADEIRARVEEYVKQKQPPG
jgi:hypothetical protein